jgi:hypothetical protein
MTARQIALIVAVSGVVALAVAGLFFPDARPYLVEAAKAILSAVPGLAL